MEKYFPLFFLLDTTKNLDLTYKTNISLTWKHGTECGISEERSGREGG